MDWKEKILLATAIFSSVSIVSAKENIVILSKKGFSTQCLVTGNEYERPIQWSFDNPNDNNLIELEESTKGWDIKPSKDIIGPGSNFEGVKLNGWTKQENTDFPAEAFRPLQDIRWNDLTSVKVTNNKSLSLNTSANGTFVENFSILARQPFELTLKSETTYFIWHIGYNHTISRKSGQVNATQIVPSEEQLIATCIGNGNDCKYNNMVTLKAPELISGTKWTSLQVKVDKNKIWLFSDSVELHELPIENGLTFKSIHFEEKIAGAYIYVKHHKYKMLVASQQPKTMSLIFEHTRKQKICVSITSYTDQEHIKVEIFKGTKNIHSNKGHKAKTKEWRVERIVTPKEVEAGNYTLKITSKSAGNNIRAIGNIRFCSAENEYYLMSIAGSDRGVKCFDAVSKSETKTNGANKAPQEDDYEISIIEAVQNYSADLAGVLVCNTTGCHCWKGYGEPKQCRNSCAKSHFGFNCRESCTNCVDQICDKSDGLCLKNRTRCLNYYRPPYCRTELLASKEPLTLSESSPSSFKLDISSAVKALKNNSVNIEYLEIDAHCSSCNVHVTQKLNWPLKKTNEVLVTGLKAESKYSIKLVVREVNATESNLNGKEMSNFWTTSCKDKNHVVHVGGVTSSEIELLWKHNSAEICSPVNYNITLNDNQTIIGTRLIKNLIPFTNYTLKIADFTKTVQTKEGEPDPVRNLAQDTRMGKDLKDNEISFSWSEPGKMNGIFKNYRVQLMHIRFIACKNVSSDRSLDVMNITDQQNITFKNLAPYSTYNLSVAAFNNKLGKISTISFNTSKLSKINAAPVIDSSSTKTGKTKLTIQWKPPDCRKAGCQIEAGLYQFSFDNQDYMSVISNSYTAENLTENTPYNVTIEARCVNNNFGGGKGLFTGQVSTDLFNELELTGIVCGSIILIVLLAAIVFLVFWLKIKNNDDNTEKTIREDCTLLDDINTELQSRYQPTPKRYGELVRKDTISDYVKISLLNGKLKTDFEMIPRGQQKEWTVGMSKQYRTTKNRYANIAAYDHSRVILEGTEENYINANFIETNEDKKAYIAAQGPTGTTADDFWHMVWQEDVSTIVMLTELVEKRERCHKYWPDLNSSRTFGEILVQMRKETFFEDHVERSLTLTGRQGSREVLQLHYTAWPHQGVPSDPRSLANFIAKVQKRKKAPLLVHCSGGTGRTGTVILVDICLKTLAKDKVVNVWVVLEKMRQQRVNLVETKEQYHLAHIILAHYVTEFM